MFKKKGSVAPKAEGGGLDFIKKKDINEWTVVEVGLWLNAINLSQYSDAFFFNEIDGEMLADLDEDDLIAMPIERMGHRKKILRRVAKIKNPNPSSGSHKNSESDSASIDSEAKRDSSSSSASHQLRVKCLFHDEIRTIVFRSDDTIDSFNDKIRDEFGSNQAAKYRDEDGDMVTIRNSEDLRSFLLSAKSGKGKLTIFSTRKSKKKTKKSRKKEKKSKSETSGEDFDVLENFVDAVIVSDRKGTIQFFNGAAEDLFGYDREELIGQNVRVLMNAEDAKHHNQYLRRYRREGNSKIIGKGRRVVGRAKDGKPIEIWLSLSETDTTFTGIVQPIQVERGPVVEPVKFRDLSVEFSALTNYPSPMFVVNDDGFIQFANPAAHSAFLYENGSLLGQNVSIICPAVSAENGEDLLSDYMATLNGKKATLLSHNARDVICYTKKGTLIAKIAEFSHRQVDATLFYVVEFKSQDALKEKDQSSTVLQAQRAVISTLIIPALIIDENAIVQEMNPAAREIFGFSISEVLGRNVNIMIPAGELFDIHTSLVRNYALTGKGRGPNGTSSVVGKGREVIGQAKDGHQLRLLLSVTMATEKSGEKIFTGILQLLAKVEKSLLDSAVLKQQVDVIEQLIVPACVITQDSIVRAFNKAAQDIFGFSERELVGKDVNNLIPIGEIHNIHGKLVQNFSDGKKSAAESVVVGKGRKVTGRHKDGHHVNVMLAVTERRDGNVVIFTGTFTAL